MFSPELLQSLVDKLANSIRIYAEASLNFHTLKNVDLEEAVNNLERAFEAKLEAFHSLYEVSSGTFNYFGYADTTLLIIVRNAIHHRNHSLFRSWNSEMSFHDGLKIHSGKKFLLVNFGQEEPLSSKYYYKLEDVFDRIDEKRHSEFLSKKMSKNNRLISMNLINTDLNFLEIEDKANSKNYPLSSVYFNIIPVFSSAISRVFVHLQKTGFTPKGFDSETYFPYFLSNKSADFDSIQYQDLQIPDNHL